MDARIDDRDWCAARLAAGDTVAAIGQAAGVSRQTASAWLKRHGLQANHRPHERPGVEQLTADYGRTRSMRKLAAEYGISSGGDADLAVRGRRRSAGYAGPSYGRCGRRRRPRSP